MEKILRGIRKAFVWINYRNQGKYQEIIYGAVLFKQILIRPATCNLNNSFRATGIFRYPLKTSENQRFSGLQKEISHRKWFDPHELRPDSFVVIFPLFSEHSLFQSKISEVWFLIVHEPNRYLSIRFNIFRKGN